jgi:hypothetical protein
MAEWLGHVLANWPVWLFIPALIIIIVIYIIATLIWFPERSQFKKRRKRGKN